MRRRVDETLRDLVVYSNPTARRARRADERVHLVLVVWLLGGNRSRLTGRDVPNGLVRLRIELRAVVVQCRHRVTHARRLEHLVAKYVWVGAELDRRRVAGGGGGRKRQAGGEQRKSN